MDFHEAKDRTLWKLAFCYSGKWSDMADLDCSFCTVTRRIYLSVIGDDGITEKADCKKCPVDRLCSSYLDTRIKQLLPGQKHPPELWRHFFDKLLAIPMPEII